MQNINELFEDEVWLNSKVIDLYSYRRALCSPVYFDKYHCKTNKGHIVFTKQYRKDFYKPRNWDINETGFFALDKVLTREALKEKLLDENNPHLNLFNQLLNLTESGHVISKWDIKEVRTTNFVTDESYEILKSYGTKPIPGYIRVMKYSNSQYETHTPMESNAGTFYYATEYSHMFKPDYDYRFDENENFVPSATEVIAIENEDYDVVTSPVEIDCL